MGTQDSHKPWDQGSECLQQLLFLLEKWETLFSTHLLGGSAIIGQHLGLPPTLQWEEQAVLGLGQAGHHRA